MKFLVRRTSLWGEKEKPCNDDRLTFEEYDRIEIRTLTEDEFNKKFSRSEGLWRSEGIEHKTCNDGKWIQRTFPKERKGWFIEIETLEELMELKKNVGYGLVLTTATFNKYQECIEIYDDYRE